MSEQKSSTDTTKAAQEPIELPEVIKFVNENDISGVEKMLATGVANVHESDSTGMTPLMHASYKGYADMCKMLIIQGSDVNADAHSHCYSPLHFAALSSNLDTVQLLLDNGAKTYKKNTLSRTAAEMAGFVGHSACVAIINNHLDRKELKRYTKPSSDHQKTRLHPEAEEELYKVIMEVNLSPVSLTLKVGRSSKLLNHLSDAAAVLNSLSVAETKKSSNVNEVLSLKLHYISYLLKHLDKEFTKYNQKEDNKINKNNEPDSVPHFESFLKQLLKCRNTDGAEIWQELWLRDAIKTFHCVEMPLFLEVARNLSGQEVLALSVLSGSINGQRGFAEENTCTTCTVSDKSNKHCSKCKAVQYCNRYCQRLHWMSHKKFCEKITDQNNTQEKN